MTYKDDIIAELRAVVDDLKEQNRAQANRIAELELQLAKALKNSSNSSKSPSSDIVKPPKKKADGRKKAKRGGQKGHPRMLREPLPPERVNEEFTYEIDAADVRELDRRITQGTRSEFGQRYHERMWTAIATCDKQGRSFFQFLHASLTAKLTGMTPPTLLPR